MHISVVGYQGFIGSAVVRAIERVGLHSICVGRTDKLSPHTQLVIDCNGNSSKFLTNKNPKVGYLDIVESVSERMMQLQGDPRYVYISSGEVYGEEQDYSKEVDPIEILELSCYGKFKFEAEGLVRDRFGNHLIVRPSGFVGVGLKKNPIFDLMQASQVFVHEESLFQFCDVDWFADTILNVALKNFIGTLNVSALGSISIKDVTEQMKIQRPKFAPEARLELHRLNTELLSKFIEVPSTFTHVESYVTSIKNQNG